MTRIAGTGVPSYVSFDRTNLRVGINSTSPARPLDVRGTVNAGNVLGVVNTDNNGFSSVLFHDESVAGKGAVGFGNTGLTGGNANYTGRMFVKFSSVDLTFSDDTTHYIYCKYSATVPQVILGAATVANNSFITVSQPALASITSPNCVTFTGGVLTTITASTNWRGLSCNFNQAHQWATGAIGSGNYRTVQMFSPTLSFVGASTATDPTTLYIADAPTVGTLATFTNAYAVFVDAGRVRLDTAIALGGGAAPTFGTIGGSGPATAAQNEWIEITTQNGRRWVPAWA